jgi:catechol 2,3-dioxygenase-like lactoylglutathione lyase family enzyme
MLSFDLGASPLGIYMLSAQDNSPGIGHFCIAVQDLNLDAAVSALTQRSADAEKAGDRAVQFRDPDRIHIELVPPKYRNPRMELNIDLRTPEPLFRPVGLNHVTLQVSNLERSTKFYESLFGPSSTGRMPGSPAVRFGKGELGWITYGVNPVGIDHFCVSVEGYDADAVTRKLKQNGIASQRPYAQNQVFVRDPDGILVQLA